ncbi:hypothetical protein LTS18_014745, partial [Coniosporium uncinatum]
MENHGSGPTSPKHRPLMSRTKEDLHLRSISNGSARNLEDGVRPALADGRKPHVCIVGAGVAGLRCAEVLVDHGVKVTIYEARDRVGGR